MKKTLEINRTNFRLLELDFRDIIEEIQNIPGVEVPKFHGPNVAVQAKRIKFRLSFEVPSLKCVEFIDNNTDEIIEYFYDWEDSSFGTFMKFHAHYHPKEAPESVKQFDPFHIHTKIDALDNEAKKREKDNEYQRLDKVLSFIKRHIYLNTVASPQRNTSASQQKSKLKRTK